MTRSPAYLFGLLFFYARREVLFFVKTHETFFKRRFEELITFELIIVFVVLQQRKSFNALLRFVRCKLNQIVSHYIESERWAKNSNYYCFICAALVIISLTVYFLAI